jgi:Tfp pilus assembly protein PilN
MAVDAEWKYAVSEVEKIKNDFAELDQRLQVLATLVEATMEQMSGLMDMMVQALPPRTGLPELASVHLTDKSDLRSLSPQFYIQTQEC